MIVSPIPLQVLRLRGLGSSTGTMRPTSLPHGAANALRDLRVIVLRDNYTNLETPIPNLRLVDLQHRTTAVAHSEPDPTRDPNEDTRKTLKLETIPGNAIWEIPKIGDPDIVP